MRKEQQEVRASFTPAQLKVFKDTCNFINECTTEQAAVIIIEILMAHGIVAFNPNHKCLREVESVCVNGAIQLNLQEWENE